MRRFALAGLVVLLVGGALTWAARDWRRQGLADEQAWRLEPAQKKLERAFMIGSVGGLLRAPNIRLDVVRVATRRGDFLHARRLLRPLLTDTTLTPEHTSRTAGWARHYAGVVDFHGHEPGDAENHHRHALAIARRLDDRELEARAWVALNRVRYHSLGRHEEAARELEAAREVARQRGDRRFEADTLRHLGAIRWWFGVDGVSPRACCYRPALDLYRQLDERAGTATMLSNMALLLRSEGDARGSLDRFRQSLTIRREIGDLAGESESLFLLGGLYADYGQYRRGARSFERALRLARSIGFHRLERDVELGLARAAGLVGEPEQAIAYLDTLATDADTAPTLVDKYRLNGMAEWWVELGDLEEARRQLARALEVAARIGTPDRGFDITALVIAMDIELASGNVTAAREIFARAMRMAEEEGGERWVLGMLEARARLVEHEGWPHLALGFLRVAAEIESSKIRAAQQGLALGLPSDIQGRIVKLLVDDRWHFADREALLFRSLQQTRDHTTRGFLARLGVIDDPAPSAPDTRRIDERLEQVLSELGDERPIASDDRVHAYEQLESLVLDRELWGHRVAFSDPLPSLADTQRRLEPGTALVLYFQSDEALFALSVTGRQARLHRLDLDLERLATKVTLARGLLLHDSDTRPWVAVTRDLHGRLIAPIEASGALAGIDRLAIFPVAALHDLPFAALMRGERFLIEDYELVFPPSVSFLFTEREGSIADVLAVGIGAYADREALPFAEREATDVVDRLGGEALVGRRATESAFKRLAPAFSTLHLATHGATEPHLPLLSSLVLMPDEIDDGLLTVHEVLQLDLDAELVTLGACQTGRSVPTDGSPAEIDRLGLIEAFLFTEARRILASHLDVRDESSLALMNEFYRHMDATDAVSALAFAQRRLLRESTWSHPRHWSPFFLVGVDR